MLGWQRYAELKKHRIDSRIAFMAMKFDEPVLSAVVKDCFKPAVAQAGFELRLLTDQQKAGLIDNHLRAALLASRFTIADLSHGSHGAYWEAGFSEGLGRPVFYTCVSVQRQRPVQDLLSGQRVHESHRVRETVREGQAVHLLQRLESSKQQLDLFSNKPDYYKNISAGSLCACSALPFIEGTVELDGDTYCEGALIDTVNFESLLQDHPDLEEIWISRIVDAKQVRKPKNLHDALGNLCQLFAATVGEDDVRLFKYHVRTKKNWTGTIVEIRVSENINFEWSHSNLDRGRADGYQAADEAVRHTRNTSMRRAEQSRNKAEVTIINEIEKDERPRKGEKTGHRRMGITRPALQVSTSNPLYPDHPPQGTLEASPAGRGV